MSRMEISFVEVMILSVVTFMLGVMFEQYGYKSYTSLYYGGLAFGVLGLILAIDFAISVFTKEEAKQ